jgi:TPR repeat protein
MRCRAGASSPASQDCFSAGNAYDRGADGHALRQDKAIELYMMGCKGRPLDLSCGALKNEVVSLQLTVARRGEALALLETACAGGSLDLCNDLASAYRDAVGTPPQPSKALTLFARTCDSSDGGATASILDAQITACRGVATILRSGAAGVEKDEARALRAEIRAKELQQRADALGTAGRP